MKTLISILTTSLIAASALGAPPSRPRANPPAPVRVAVPAVARPIQYVLISFDNCQELQTWKQVSSLLDELSTTAPIHFTFFLSAVGLLPDKDKNLYKNPSSLAGAAPNIFPERVRREHRGRVFRDFGESNIGFGGDELTVAERIDFLNRVHAAGNEIASHGVGHYDGTHWTAAMWKQELDQFDAIVDRYAGSTDVHAHLDVTSKDIQSFRAPYLGGNLDLIRELGSRGYQADSSDINRNFSSDNWPTRYSVSGRNDGPWDIGLTWTDAADRFSGPDRPKFDHLPAMDYNYCVHQTTDGCSDKDLGLNPEGQEDAQNMLHAYTDAFVRSYNGNRAPVVIGHHFFPYRNGIYNDSLAKFARTVCNQPETRCVSYQELSQVLDKMDPSERAQVQLGNFEKAAYRPSSAELLK